MLPSTRQHSLGALAQLIGLPLSITRRAADMRIFHFGDVREEKGGTVGQFALHVQCAWRIEGPAGIVTGRADLYEPTDEMAPFDKNWDYETSPNLQDTIIDVWRESFSSPPLVERVSADEFGGAAIVLEQSYTLRLFPAGRRSEDWRLFQPATETPHFVICGGKVELTGEV